MKKKAVGIVANPASGKDIRRIVTYSSAYDNQEKVNIIRRIIMALHATGVRQVYYMPEYYNLVPLAIKGMHGEHSYILSEMEFLPLEFNTLETEKDSIVAGRLLTELDVGCIITLGGDGTNRAVSHGCEKIPLIPVSTGTNNVFPCMIEGTVAGLAAGVVAMGVANGSDVFEQKKRLEIFVDGKFTDIALIDLVVMEDTHIASRAIWTVDEIKQIFVTQCAPYSIGISAIAGQYMIINAEDSMGMMLTLGKQGDRLRAAIAPGIISTVEVSKIKTLSIGEKVYLTSLPCMIAVDGERNLRIPEGREAYVQLSSNGPVVVNVEAVLEKAADSGFFIENKR
ncbi:ATP-NAD kinase [anaerobic digester metagenome]